MKSILPPALFLLLAPGFARAQAVAINNDGSTADPSAILDVKSADKGMLVPRMTTAQRAGIAAPAGGLLVYDTDAKGFWFYSGTAWVNLGGGATSTFIADTDGNTKVQTEKNPNENIIRMDLGGTEVLVLRKNAAGRPRLELWDSFDNTFVGPNAGNNTTGSFNTALGANALYANTAGISNTAVGHVSMFSNTIGLSNTATGSYALYANTTGSDNTAVGYRSLNSNTTGFQNTANGHSALAGNTSGSSTSAFGFEALKLNATGVKNTASGASALLKNTGDENPAHGAYALFNNTSGIRNTAGGVGASEFNTTGYHNVANGFFALRNNTTGAWHTAAGSQSLYSKTTGQANVAVGANALYSNISAFYNVAVGDAALIANTTGNNNVAVGANALFLNTNGYDNAAFGYQALYSNTTGIYNTAMGSGALNANTLGNYNTANGFAALYLNTTGYLNTATGVNALFNNTTGRENTANGQGSLLWNTTGSYNTAIGLGAGSFNSENTNCTFVGYEADQSVATDFDNSTALGNSARITASNQVRIGNSAISSIGGYAPWTDVSDRRFKTNLRGDVPGLPFILQLRPVTYNLDVPALAAHLQEDRVEAADTINGNTPRRPDALTLQSREAKSRIRYTGFVAQEVEQAALAIGYDFSGVDKPENEDGLYGLRYSEFVVPLVKAVQEQQAVIEMLRAEVEKLKMQGSENAALKAQSEDQKAENAALKAQLDAQAALLQKITAALQTAGSGVEQR